MTLGIGNRELVEVKLVLGECKHWLEGSKVLFLVWTDHKNLEYLQTAKRLNSHQARWALFSCFDFFISNRPSPKNTNPDALSWLYSHSPKLFCFCYTFRYWHISSELCYQSPCTKSMPQQLQWGHTKFSCQPSAHYTTQFIKLHLWWPSMKHDIHNCMSYSTIPLESKVLVLLKDITSV